MISEMEWNEVYKLWNYGHLYFGDVMSSPIQVEQVYVEYHGNSYIYGYDWLDQKTALARKKQIAENPTQFLLFTKPSNKGTIHTAEMLAEAQDEEEQAAIWIAATTKELLNGHYLTDHSFSQWAYTFYNASSDFLKQKFYLWHHAMRGLIPKLMIPGSVLENISCKDADEGARSVLGIIQLNTVLLKSLYTILCYTSLKDGKLPEHPTIRF